MWIQFDPSECFPRWGFTRHVNETSTLTSACERSVFLLLLGQSGTRSFGGSSARAFLTLMSVYARRQKDIFIFFSISNAEPKVDTAESKLNRERVGFI